MKIKIPAIDLIFNGHIDQIQKNYQYLYLQTGEQNLNYLGKWSIYHKTLRNIYQRHSNNIIFLTNPFSEMVTKNWGIITDIYWDAIRNQRTELLNFTGVVFDRDYGCFLEVTYNEISFSIFDRDFGVPYIFGSVHCNPTTSELTSETDSVLSKDRDIWKERVIPIVYYYLFSVIFERLIDEKEIVIVPPHGRKKTSQDKYINENKTGIIVWDSRKFNSYVRLDGFNVKGHLRHQRIGKDRLGHKLVWINEFQKHGYNRNRLKKQSLRY